MDLKQRKLTKDEWDAMEKPVSDEEKKILDLIINGYANVNIKVNEHKSIISRLKMEYSSKMEDYLYIKYFKVLIDIVEKELKHQFSDYKPIKIDSNIQIKGADKIRLDRNDDSTLKKQDIYENILLFHVENVLKLSESKKQSNIKMFMFHYFTLHKLLKNTIDLLNRHVVEICNNVIERFKDCVDTSVLIEHAVECVEQNPSLLQYSDGVLYDHQKEIFTVSKNKNPKLILYMAPTGTGKTLTPLGLSEAHAVLFLCGARHVGIALARAAISAGKKVAFAFGCASAGDVRLHFSAAKEFTKHRKSGGVGKVDNSVGDDVEIMISDLISYIPAMHYMRSFNRDEDLIVYWDEPTITLDYDTHEFHDIIQKNWKENLIPNMVLSSATLPRLSDLELTIPDFKDKFPQADIYNIVSHDCKKSIPIINKSGYVVLPHHMSSDYDEILKIVDHCENYLTILRYFDLEEVVGFITYVNNNYSNNKMTLGRHFDTLDEINMKNIKVYYLKLLKNINKDKWGDIHSHFMLHRKLRIPSNDNIDTKGNKIKNTPQTCNNGTAGVYVTTKDAHTLTDGPTIFITDDVEKIAKFSIQQANIPSVVMDDLMQKIEYNNMLNEKINELENNLEYLKEQAEKTMKNTVSSANAGVKVQGRSKSTKDFKKINRDTLDDSGVSKGDISKITNEINSVRSLIKEATLNDTFVPNKQHHIAKWAEEFDTKRSFASDIEDNIVNEIMLLNGIDDLWKVLLMMGIGVFISHDNIKYTEIMKQLADDQKLYMIIASSDYIYGTNYQFCHGYISKDLNLTQEKLIQAMGRVGRNNIQQNYTLRFRDDLQILKLFTSETEKPEIINMNRLFNSNKVVWEDKEYKGV